MRAGKTTSAATYKAAERKRRRDMGETCVQVWLTADQRKNLEYIVEADAKPIQQAVRDAILTEYMICRGWVVVTSPNTEDTGQWSPDPTKEG